MNDELFVGINRIKDPANPTELEKKHLPTIVAPDEVPYREPFEVEIIVGKELPHPDKGDHFIQNVELYAGEAFLARCDFTPTVSGTPMRITLKLNYDTPLCARSRCNLHGVWESEKMIRIVKN